MTTKQHLGHADEAYIGAAYYEAAFALLGRKGQPVNPTVRVDLGAPITLDADGLIKAATSTELPDTETVTYTFPDDGGTSPVDGANQTGILDVPRNITVATTHGSSVVAMTIVVTGTDYYGDIISETIAVAATGTSQSDAGAKAFKTVTSIAITAAADAEANTVNIGWGDVLGLPYRADNGTVFAFFADNTEELASATVVVADTNTATGTTGDVRGTITPNTACDGSVNYYALMIPAANNTKEALFGVDNYAG